MHTAGWMVAAVDGGVALLLVAVVKGRRVRAVDVVPPSPVPAAELDCQPAAA